MGTRSGAVSGEGEGEGGAEGEAVGFGGKGGCGGKKANMLSTRTSNAEGALGNEAELSVTGQGAPASGADAEQEGMVLVDLSDGNGGGGGGGSGSGNGNGGGSGGNGGGNGGSSLSPSEVDDSSTDVKQRSKMRMLLAEQRLRDAMGSIARSAGRDGEYGRVAGSGDEEEGVNVGGGATYGLD